MTPFAFAGTFQLPADAGLAADPISINMTGQYGSENRQVLDLVGTGTASIPFGTAPSAGLKGLLIKVDANPTSAPVLVTINGSADPIEISPGGFIAVGSPTPGAGITSISIAYTTANKVRVWALG